VEVVVELYQLLVLLVAVVEPVGYQLEYSMRQYRVQ